MDDKLIGSAIAVVTFVSGYLLSQFDRRRDQRRQQANMRRLLLEEMKATYLKYANILPRRGDGFDSFSVPTFLAALSEAEFAVYDASLGRLGSLLPKEVELVYGAYKALRNARSSAKDYGQMLEDAKAKRSVPAELLFFMLPVLATSAVALGALSEAIGTLHGSEELEESLAARGGRSAWDLRADLTSLIEYLSPPKAQKKQASNLAGPPEILEP